MKYEIHLTDSQGSAPVCEPFDDGLEWRHVASVEGGLVAAAFVAAGTMMENGRATRARIYSTMTRAFDQDSRPIIEMDRDLADRVMEIKIGG